MPDVNGSTRPVGPPVDLEEGLDRVGDDAAFFKELFEMFLEDAPGRLEALHRSILASETESASREAHGLKGAAANLSANPFRDVAYAIERAGKAGEATELMNLYEELRREYDRLVVFAKTL